MRAYVAEIQENVEEAYERGNMKEVIIGMIKAKTVCESLKIAGF